MVVVWAAAALGILIALPGPMFVDSSGCRGGTRLNLPQLPMVQAYPFQLDARVHDRGIEDAHLDRPTWGSSNVPFDRTVLKWRPQVHHMGYPMSFWTVITPEVDCLSTRNISRAELTALRSIMADLVLDMDDDLAQHASWIRGAHMPIVRHHWIGYLVDPPFWIVAMLSLISAVRALRWIGSALTAPSKRDLLARGICPTCRYDLRGLPSDVCPECGTGFERAACHG